MVTKVCGHSGIASSQVTLLQTLSNYVNCAPVLWIYNVFVDRIDVRSVVVFLLMRIECQIHSISVGNDDSSDYLPIFQSICLSVCPSFRWLVGRSVRSSIHPSVRPSIDRSFCLSIHPYVGPKWLHYLKFKLISIKWSSGLGPVRPYSAK